MKKKGTVGIVVGGGPAPGINGVIAAVTIEAINHGYNVIGFEDGFKWLAKGEIEGHYQTLTKKQVERIHHKGGSILGTSRVNPTKAKKTMKNLLDSFDKLGVDNLVTIGGDDTASSSSKIAEKAKGIVKVVHVPKTIDNDLPLKGSISTFGFQTARHYGVGIVEHLMEDAITTKRWYICVSMGRKAGHLALGIGKAAGAHLTLIGEELKNEKIPFSVVCDVIEGTMLKRKAQGEPYGIIVIAEGIIESIDKKDIKGLLKDATIDKEHDHLTLSELHFGEMISKELKERFKKRGDDVRVIEKNIGYELRCAPPIPFDCEYTRDLGYGAMQLLIIGESGLMVSIEAGKTIGMPYATLLDSETGKVKVRLVDIESSTYKIAREYMIRLEQEDFEGENLKKLAKAAGMEPDAFRKYYEKLVDGEEYFFKYEHSV